MSYLDKRIFECVTINVDASAYPQQLVGGYAFWIKGPFGKHTGSGAFKNNLPAKDFAKTAEIWAIGNAIYTLRQLLDESATFYTYLIINNDSTHAHYAIEKKLNAEAAKVHQAISDLHKHQLRIIKARHPGLRSNLKIAHEFRYVASHSGNFDVNRNYVNEWCDLHARNAARKVLGIPLLKSIETKDK